jgi:hypothetical protein
VGKPFVGRHNSTRASSFNFGGVLQVEVYNGLLRNTLILQSHKAKENTLSAVLLSYRGTCLSLLEKTCASSSFNCLADYDLMKCFKTHPIS